MRQIGNINEINEVKAKLTGLQSEGKIKEWELPYENLLTRRTAAVFFLTGLPDSNIEFIWRELAVFPEFIYDRNTEKILSQMEWTIEFRQDQDVT